MVLEFGRCDKTMNNENITHVMNEIGEIIFTGKYSECCQYTLNEYLKNLDKYIQPVTDIFINKKVIISPRVNQPWGGQEGYITAVRFTGIYVCFPSDNSVHEFPKVALYENK